MKTIAIILLILSVLFAIYFAFVGQFLWTIFMIVIVGVNINSLNMLKR